MGGPLYSRARYVRARVYVFVYMHLMTIVYESDWASGGFMICHQSECESLQQYIYHKSVIDSGSTKMEWKKKIILSKLMEVWSKNAGIGFIFVAFI